MIYTNVDGYLLLGMEQGSIRQMDWVNRVTTQREDENIYKPTYSKKYTLIYSYI